VLHQIPTFAYEREQGRFPSSSRKLPQSLILIATNLLQMASILKVGDAWRAQVRRKGHKSVSETFPTKAQAVAWARKVEAEMDAKRFQDVRGLANLTLKMLITRYREEIGAEAPFGKNKKAVLDMWERITVTKWRPKLLMSI
jgi:hypothetical protein